MKLSVIIPVYRTEATLDRCVESVTRQTFSDLEVILVDDGSPDRCPQLCDGWAARDSRIRVVHKQNGGLSDARNAGLDAARGELVTFVDSDDFLAPDTYGELMAEAETADLVEYPFFWHYGANDQRLCRPEAREYADAADYWLQGHAYEHTYACNKVFRRSLFDGVRFPRGKVFEDAWTLPPLIGKARRIVVSGKGLYYYCHNQQGITAQAGGKQLEMLLDAHLRLMGTWCDDRYYLYVANIQLDVCERTGATPRLPHRRIRIGNAALSGRQRLKAIALNLLGINKLCSINKILHRLMPRHWSASC